MTKLSGLLALFAATFLLWIMYAGLLFLWVIDGRVKRETALHSFVVSISSWGLAELAKNLFHSLRPYVINQRQAFVLWPGQGDGSFPSGHAAAAFGLAAAVFLHSKKLGTIFLLLAIAVGAGRVWANVHFPIDVLAGAILGVVTALVFEKLHVYRLLSRIR